MCVNHRFKRFIAGMLVCTLCGMVIYETIENRKSQPHNPEYNFNNTVNPNPITTIASGTASTVAGTIAFTPA